MKALQFERSVTKYIASKAISTVSKRYRASTSPLVFKDGISLVAPEVDYIKTDVTLSGICGSDLGMLSASSSRYFEDFITFPFVPGHEIVGRADIDGVERRVVVEPVLGCIARNVPNPCRFCAKGEKDKCVNLVVGCLEPGVQSGYCESTGGGWSEYLYCHPSQLHVVPDSLSDEEALLVEPLACALHIVKGGNIGDVKRVAIIGSGTVGLLVAASLSRLRPDIEVISLARYSHQQKIASGYGSSIVKSNDELRRVARSFTRGVLANGRVTDGFDLTIDAVGSKDSVELALEVTAPGGRILMAAIPKPTSLDLTALWHKSISMEGRYAYGVEEVNGEVRSTFEIALDLAPSLSLGNLVTKIYPLEDYEDAINHAVDAGSRGAVKIAFDPSTRHSRTPRKVS